MALLTNLDPASVIVTFLGLYLLYAAVYPWVFSPLKHIPGPWFALYTKWWLVYKTNKGIRSKTIHDLHEKYGPWVRVAPFEVSTTDTEAIVPIYGVNSNFVKTEFYTYQLRGKLRFSWTQYRAFNIRRVAIPELFTMSNRKDHATRRRQLAHLFSMSTITEYEPLIARNVGTCMDLIAAEGRAGKSSNLYDWWHYLSMDVVCELSFGLTFDMLNKGSENAYIKDLYGSLQIEPIRWHFGWLNRYASWAPIKYVRDAEACSVRAMDSAIGIVRDYQQSAEKKQKKDLLQKMIDARDDQGQPLPSEALGVEAASFILAGSHTTSSSLTWIVWRLLKHPDITKKLIEELDTALAETPRTTVPVHQPLEKLTWLNCIIKEGLRIDTAVPGSTPRYVPAEGALINGVTLPSGTIVSAQAYSCHRDTAIFPNPEAFLPERWLQETPAMRRSYIPFGADGPRKCIGIHLAYMELRVVLAALFHRFELSFAYPTDDRSMDLDEYWLANPISQRLDVIAKERV